MNNLIILLYCVGFISTAILVLIVDKNVNKHQGVKIIDALCYLLVSACWPIFIFILLHELKFFNYSIFNKIRKQIVKISHFYIIKPVNLKKKQKKFVKGM